MRSRARPRSTSNLRRGSPRLDRAAVQPRAVEQPDILQPAAIVALKQVAHDYAAGVRVGVDADELGAFVGGADGAFGQYAPNGVRFLRVGLAEPLEHQLLTFVVAVDGEGHELVEGEPVFGIDIEQLGRDRRQAQALLHDGDRHEKSGGDFLLGLTLSRNARNARNWSSG